MEPPPIFSSPLPEEGELDEFEFPFVESVAEIESRWWWPLVLVKFLKVSALLIELYEMMGA